MTRLETIISRLNARPGDENFEPAYMLKNIGNDIQFIIDQLTKTKNSLTIAHKAILEARHHLEHNKIIDQNILRNIIFTADDRLK